jgi:hypothetical protein
MSGLSSPAAFMMSTISIEITARLTIFGRKRRNLRVVYGRIGAADVVLLGEVLKLRWRGPTPPLRVTLGERGASMSSSHQRGGHRYTSRAAPAEPEGLCGTFEGGKAGRASSRET